MAPIARSYILRRMPDALDCSLFFLVALGGFAALVSGCALMDFVQDADHRHEHVAALAVGLLVFALCLGGLRLLGT